MSSKRKARPSGALIPVYSQEDLSSPESSRYYIRLQDEPSDEEVDLKAEVMNEAENVYHGWHREQYHPQTNHSHQRRFDLSTRITSPITVPPPKSWNMSLGKCNRNTDVWPGCAPNPVHRVNTVPPPPPPPESDSPPEAPVILPPHRRPESSWAPEQISATPPCQSGDNAHKRTRLLNSQWAYPDMTRPPPNSAMTTYCSAPFSPPYQIRTHIGSPEELWVQPESPYGPQTASAAPSTPPGTSTQSTRLTPYAEKLWTDPGTPPSTPPGSSTEPNRWTPYAEKLWAEPETPTSKHYYVNEDDQQEDTSKPAQQKEEETDLSFVTSQLVPGMNGMMTDHNKPVSFRFKSPASQITEPRKSTTTLSSHRTSSRSGLTLRKTMSPRQGNDSIQSAGSSPNLPAKPKKTRWSLATPSELDEQCKKSLLSNPSRFSSPSAQDDSAWVSVYAAKCSTSRVPYIDSHCHLDFLFKRDNHYGSLRTYMQRERVANTTPANFAGCVAIFCEPYFWKLERKWCSLLLEDNIWGSFGVHPKYAEQWCPLVESQLRSALKHKKVRAVGEIGLDYSRGLDGFKMRQKEAFRTQLLIAIEYKLPIVIHCRDADMDCFNIMKELVPSDYKVHRHCFTEDFSCMQMWMSWFSSMMFGLTPLVTFPTARSTHEVARRMPLDKLLLETDAPYFMPRMVPRDRMPHTHPGMAITVAAEVASLRHIPLDDVLTACRENTKRLYSI